MTVFFAGVVEGVLTTVSVNLLRSQTEHGGRQAEEQGEDDKLMVSFTDFCANETLTHPIIRPLLKIRENSKCRLTLGSRAAADIVSKRKRVALGRISDSRFAGALYAILIDEQNGSWEN